MGQYRYGHSWGTTAEGPLISAMGKWVTSKVFCSKRDRCFSYVPRGTVAIIYVFLAGGEVLYMLHLLRTTLF
jgi:hypothetical protein